MNLNDQKPSRPKVTGRLAPSPSGRLHMGNLLSFMVASLSSDELVLRIEDLDPQRSKQCFVDQLLRDLEYLGFEWIGKVLRQSERSEAYRHAYQELDRQGLLYPCFCTRADLHSADAPHFGEELVYANTCRKLTDSERQRAWESSFAPGARRPSWRLEVTDQPFVFDDLFQGHQCWRLTESSGDFIVRRSDGVFAYQLAVVVDDAAQGVGQVVRGIDLLSSVPRQRYLQDLLGLPNPQVGHVPLLVDGEGRRLSKRNGDASLSHLIDDRHVGASRIFGHLAWLCGIVPEPCSLGLDELRRYASLDVLKGKQRIVWTPLVFD
ncbi:MAG: tRNA glutamyl-Q(34) synthetase GluQRS [Coriobacteriia bacterium]|nr:tRNA glutamyl-Q(34) synthetase GluQRS [Coriobacteriia bacterium]